MNGECHTLSRHKGHHSSKPFCMTIYSLQWQWHHRHHTPCHIIYTSLPLPEAATGGHQKEAVVWDSFPLKEWTIKSSKRKRWLRLQSPAISVCHLPRWHVPSSPNPASHTGHSTAQMMLSTEAKGRKIISSGKRCGSVSPGIGITAGCDCNR